MRALHVRGLGRTIRHGDGELVVLQAVDVSVAPGQAVGITGPLDSGWRSLLRLIVGLDPHSAGTIELASPPGQAPAGPPHDRTVLRQEIVLASALDSLLDAAPKRTVAGIARLMASRRRAVRGMQWDAIVSAAAAPLRKDDWTRCDRLRIALAIACALEPSHVLLEVEPPLASGDDRRRLADFVRGILATGRGMLIGSRDELLLADVASHVLIFEDGAVLAEGTPDSVLTAAWQQVGRGGKP